VGKNFGWCLEMALLSRIIDIPLFLEVGENCLENLTSILSSNSLSFRKAVVLFDRTTYQIAGRRIYHLLGRMKTCVDRICVEECTIEFTEIVRERIRESGCDVVFGVGGGKVLDTGKYAAALERINFISVPTCPSNDGIASPVAVIEKNGRKKSLGAKMPLGIIADLGIIKASPLRNIRAGIGDLISNLSAVEDWKLASRKRAEKFDNFAALLSVNASEALLNIGGPNILDFNFLRKLVEGLVMGGIAMGIAGSSRPCSGAEHKFSHGLDAILAGPTLHGEQVAIGTIVATYLRGGDYKKIVSFLKVTGVPVNSRQLGVPEEKMVEALVYAPKTRPERFTILEDIKIDEKMARDALIKTGVI